MVPAVRTGVVIGFGSIGRTHAALLEELCSDLVIVDIDASLAERTAKHPHARLARSLDDVTDVDWDRTVAAIATWGPSHASLFDALADRGVRTILCEKPMATSVADAEAMATRARRDGIALAVHHHLRYAGLVSGLEALARDHALGAPEAVIVDGGARCLVTNGVHYVDLVTALFGETPIRVVSDARGDAINPRSPTLSFFGGTAAWRYPSGRSLSISFSNRSSITERLRVLYSDAVIDLDEMFNAVVSRRPADARLGQPITRSGRATDVVHTGPVPGYKEFPEPSRALLADLVAGEARGVGAEHALVSVGACIGALASGRDGVALDLPIDPSSPLGKTTWPMS